MFGRRLPPYTGINTSGYAVDGLFQSTVGTNTPLIDNGASAILGNYRNDKLFEKNASGDDILFVWDQNALVSGYVIIT